MSRDLSEKHEAGGAAVERVPGCLPLKGFQLHEDEWSPWYTDDFGLATRISWQRASDRSIIIHNLAAAPNDPDPSSRFVHVTYEVDLPTGRKSSFRIQAEYLDGLAAEDRQWVRATLERAIAMATGTTSA